MKKSIVILVTSAIVAGSIIISCQTPAQKVSDAKEKVADEKVDVLVAREELNTLIIDSLADYQKTKMMYETRIKDQEKFLADFKSKIASEKQDVKESYEIQIAAIEKKNNEMKNKLENMKDDGSESWDSFKKEFNHDMKELNEAFKGLANDSKK